MADFRTHIAWSTVAGIGYAAWGYTQGAPLETAVMAGGLCSVAGMLPDLDSDSGRPAREMFPLVAAVVPALMLARFRGWGLSNEWIVVATGAIYLLIRFGVSAIFKRFTVHRGMWHSVPACAIVGLITFLLCPKQELMLRGYIAVAVMLGFTVHLLLDEIWSVSLSTKKFGLKNSWGTALKFWSNSPLATFVTYAKLLVLIAATIGDPTLMDYFQYDAGYSTPQVRSDAREFLNERIENARHWLREDEEETWR